MAASSSSFFVILSCLLAFSIALPEHGHNKQVIVNSSLSQAEISSGCTSMTLASSSRILVTLYKANFSGSIRHAQIGFKVTLYENQCEAIDKLNCPIRSKEDSIMINEETYNVSNGLQNLHFFSDMDRPLLQTREDILTLTEDSADETDPLDNRKDWKTFFLNSSGVYDVVIELTSVKPKKANFTLYFQVDMKNKYGYLSLVDYPAMIVYSILLVVYITYAIIWLVLMAIDYKDLVRLQFWILGVILLGFLEKVFFVAEFGTANSGLDSAGLIYVAEGVSAAKRALARVLLIIVCEGFGTVKPRLGQLLTKVVAVGVLYFIVAFIDGVLRASKGTGDHGLTTMLTFGILFLLDTAIVYWIFSALVSTRRNLRVRKNIVKLSLYNHLGYALIATILASLAFIIWQFIYITKNDCTSDWREMWLIDCFWHMLFCFMLLIIMIIWRPSANKLRFAYSPVSNGDTEDEEEEQGANKNFETVKMRQVKDSTKQPLTSHEAEEDLKWVEQNLPTTAIDKAAQMVLDSEEEVMTTRFEASKMN